MTPPPDGLVIEFGPHVLTAIVCLSLALTVLFLLLAVTAGDDKR